MSYHCLIHCDLNPSYRRTMLSAIQYLDLHQGGFPSPEFALTDPDGLLAIGGDLSPSRLIDAYRRGIFPWFNYNDPILWWCPSQRAVFQPEQVHLSRSTKRLLRKFDFRYSINQAFSQVVRACAEPRNDGEGTWITEPMIQAYQQLHDQGDAHSLEVWLDDNLIGGIYGVCVGGVFCGESMFHRHTGASKIALYQLGQHCLSIGVELIDAQIDNPHLRTLGSTMMDRDRFIETLERLRNKALPPSAWHTFEAAIDV